MTNGGIVGSFYSLGGGTPTDLSAYVKKSDFSPPLEFWASPSGSITPNRQLNRNSYAFLDEDLNAVSYGNAAWTMTSTQIASIRWWLLNEQVLSHAYVPGVLPTTKDFSTEIAAIVANGDTFYGFAEVAGGAANRANYLELTVAAGGINEGGPDGLETTRFPCRVSEVGDVVGDLNTGNVFHFVGNPLGNLPISAAQIEDAAALLKAANQLPIALRSAVLQNGLDFEGLSLTLLKQHFLGVKEKLKSLGTYQRQNGATPANDRFSILSTGFIRFKLTGADATLLGSVWAENQKMTLGTAKITLGRIIERTDDILEAAYTLDSGTLPVAGADAAIGVEGKLVHWEDLATALTQDILYPGNAAMFSVAGDLSIDEDPDDNTIEISHPPWDFQRTLPSNPIHGQRVTINGRGNVTLNIASAITRQFEQTLQIPPAGYFLFYFNILNPSRHFIRIYFASADDANNSHFASAASGVTIQILTTANVHVGTAVTDTTFTLNTATIEGSTIHFLEAGLAASPIALTDEQSYMLAIPVATTLQPEDVLEFNRFHWHQILDVS